MFIQFFKHHFYYPIKIIKKHFFKNCVIFKWKSREEKKNTERSINCLVFV